MTETNLVTYIFNWIKWEKDFSASQMELYWQVSRISPTLLIFPFQFQTSLGGCHWPEAMFDITLFLHCSCIDQQASRRNSLGSNNVGLDLFFEELFVSQGRAVLFCLGSSHYGTKGLSASCSQNVIVHSTEAEMRRGFHWHHKNLMERDSDLFLFFFLPYLH